jgi:hypothetical protein
MEKHMGRAGYAFIMIVPFSFIGRGLDAVTEGETLPAYVAQTQPFQLGLVAAAAVLIVGMFASAALSWMMQQPRANRGLRK